MAELETRSFEQLPEATTLSPDDIITMQSPNGPAKKIKVGQAFALFQNCDIAVETVADLTTDAAAIALPSQSLAVVYANPDPTESGYWVKTSVAGSGTWALTDIHYGYSAGYAAESKLAAHDAAEMRDLALAAASSRGYRPTLAAAIADFGVGDYFLSDDQEQVTDHPNELRLYRRVGAAPFYQDQGDEASPLGRSYLERPDGAKRIGFRRDILDATARPLSNKLEDTFSVKDFGARGNDQAIDTAAFQRAIAAARQNGADLYIPLGTYIIDQPLEILFNEAKRGLRIYSGNSGSYYGESRHATIRYTGDADFCVRIVGPDTGDGAPAFVSLDGLRFIGNNNCPGAVLIQRSWHVDLGSCSFIGFGNVDGGAITLRANGPTGFAGIVDIQKCTFSNCGRNVKLTGSTGGQINVLKITGCKGVDQKNAIVSDWGGQLPFTSNVKVRDCLWEGSIGVVIQSDGVAGSWTIEGGYIEDSNPLTPFKFEGGGNYGINVQGVFFRKSGLAAGQALTYIINGTDCNFAGNSSGFGNEVDRFSADFVACQNSYAAPADGISLTPYPIRMNNFIKDKAVTSNWFAQMPKGTGLFCGISSGDGWPGGTVCTIQDEFSQDNSLVRVSCNITINEKSPAGEQVLIGLLPERNGFYNRPFPVFTQNVAGDGPFFAVLPAGGVFATVYDRNRVPLNYQAAVSAGSYFEFTFDYLAQE